MMAILGWIFVIMSSISAIGVAAIVFWVGLLPHIKVKLSREVIPLMDKIQIKEISDNEQPLPYERRPGTGDVAAAERMLLAEDGTLEKERLLKKGETFTVVYVLTRSEDAQSLVVAGNDVYHLDNEWLGDHLGTFSGPAFSGFDHVTAVTEDTLLLAGAVAGDPYAERHLYQIDLPECHQQELAADPYYLHSRPPKIFRPEGFNGVVVVYYTGYYSFSFGGDESRPKYSVIRVYNKDFPKGQNVAKLGFKAGTVVNVAWQNGVLILQADPSLPGVLEKPRAPARVWRVQILSTI